MHTFHSRRQAIVVVLVLAITPSLSRPAWAATEFADSIPLEIAKAFLGIVPNEAGAAVYADVADNFPAVAFPPAYTVLGSVVRPFGQTVYLRAEVAAVPDAATAMNAFAELYAAAGWQSMDLLRRVYLGGFTGNEPTIFPTQLCHDDFGNLSISATAADYLLVTLTRNDTRMNGGQNCSEMLATQQQIGYRRAAGGRAFEQYMPRLEVPAEANGGRPGGGGSMSSSNDEMEAAIALQLPWDPADVYQHFAEQIAAQGWMPDGSWETSAITGGSWTSSPAADINLVGMLTIVQKDADSYQLKFRIVAR